MKKTNVQNLKVAVKNFQGKLIKERKLSKKVFGLEPKADLIKQVYLAIFANQRKAIAHTKNRSERAGSTRKPWRQKGTGRARTGSIRNPIWRKGGIVFGPTKERDFSQKVNFKMKRKAIRMVLSGKLREGELMVVDNFNLEKPKTKEMAQAIKKLNLEGKKVLMAFCKEEKEQSRFSRNIEEVSNLEIEKLNVFDLINHKFLLISEKGLDFLEKKYEEEKKKKMLISHQAVKNNNAVKNDDKVIKRIKDSIKAVSNNAKSIDE